MDWSAAAQKLVDALGLEAAPVGVAFRNEVPVGVNRVSRAAPSACTFWKMAADGEVFYAQPADHFGCPIGAYTHGLQLSEKSAQELGEMIGMMSKLDYLREAEVPEIPTLKGGFGVAIYAPLARMPAAPDVVILCGNPRQLMMAAEAARASGMEGTRPMRERPTCAMIPEVLQTSQGQPSFSCIGNRVYTGLKDEGFYFALPGSKLDAFVAKVEALVSANQQLEAFHRARLTSAVHT